MEKLYVFVEGIDDERFFRHYFHGENVKIIQYAKMSHKEFTSYIRTISQIRHVNYIVLADADGASIDAKKKKIQAKHPICDFSKLFISQWEIESWYIAGLPKNSFDKHRKKYIHCTDTLSKEKFETLIPKGFTSVSFKMEILKCFDYELAKNRNKSFQIFLDAQQNRMSPMTVSGNL